MSVTVPLLGSSDLNYDQDMNVSIPVNFYQKNDNCFGPWIHNQILTPSSSNSDFELQFVATKSVHDNDIYLCTDNFHVIKEKSEKCISQWFRMDDQSKRSVFLKWATLINSNIDTLTSLEYFNRNMLIEWTAKDVLRITEYLNSCSRLIPCVSAVNEDKRKYVTFDGSLIEFAWVVISHISLGYAVWAFAPKHSALSALCLAQLGSEAGLPPDTFNIVTVISDQPSFQFALVNDLTFFNKRKGCTFVIFEDSDIESAIDLIVEAAASHRGMLLWSPKSVLVQECIYEQFKIKLSKKKLNLSYSYRDFSLTKDTINQLKIMDEIIEKSNCEGIEMIKLEDVTKNTAALFLLENISTVLLEDVQSNLSLPIVHIQTFRTCKEATNLMNLNYFKKDIATSQSYQEKKAAVSIWSNCSAISFDMAFAAQSNLIWINNYDVSPKLWHPNKRNSIISDICVDDTKTLTTDEDEDDFYSVSENSLQSFEKSFEISFKQKKTWNVYSNEKKEDIFKAAYEKLKEAENIFIDNKYGKRSETCDESTLSPVNQNMRKHILSTLLYNFSNGKEILDLFKDHIKVENEVFTIRQYSPMGTIMIHTDRKLQMFPSLIMLALALGNSIILCTKNAFLIDLAKFLQEMDFPIITHNYKTFSLNHAMGNRIFYISVTNLNEYSLSSEHHSQISLTPQELINLFSNKKYIYCTYGS